MSAPKITVASLAALVALTLACTKSSAPTSPASSSSVGGVIGPLAATGGTTPASLSDPVTLKVTAPTPISPINNQKPDVLVLTATAAAGKFVPLGPLGYRFPIIGPTGAVIQDSGLQPSPSFAGGVTTEVDKVHTWVVRAEFQGAVGPWSAPASFIASNTVGYIRGTELYDALTNGKTIGTIGGAGNITWVPGQGIRMNDERAYVVYELQQVFSSGEISVEVTGLNPGGPCCKPRIFSILDRANAVSSASKYMINVQYRGAGGAPDNAIAWKAVLGDNANSLEPNTDKRNASVYLLDPSKVYLWQAFWTPTSVRVVVNEGSKTGPLVYDYKVDATSGTTNWNPEQMFAFLGTNNGTYVPFDGTRAGMTLRNLWVGSTPRPTTLP